MSWDTIIVFGLGCLWVGVVFLIWNMIRVDRELRGRPSDEWDDVD